MIEYKISDKNLSASQFISFVNQVWKGNHDLEKTSCALSKTLNITAYDKLNLSGVYEYLQTVIILEQSQSCLSCQSIKKWELEASCLNLLKNIHQPCFILAHNKG